MMSQGPEQKVLVWKHNHAPLLQKVKINVKSFHNKNSSNENNRFLVFWEECLGLEKRQKNGFLPLSRLSRYSAACKRAAMLLMFVCFLRKIWSQKKGKIWLLYLVKMVLMWVKMKMVETELMVVRLMFLTRLVSLLECTLQSLPSLHSSWQKKDSVTRQNILDKENSGKNTSLEN